MPSDTDFPEDPASESAAADHADGHFGASVEDEDGVKQVATDRLDGSTETETDASLSGAARSPHLRLVTSNTPASSSEGETASAIRKIEDPDVALVEAAKTGDQRAFGALFDRHHGRVHAMCCRLLRDRVEVEDAVQHAFLEAWRCLHKFEGRSKFSTWITRIAIHTCLGIRRKLKRLFLSEDASPMEAADDDGQWGSSPMAPDEGAAHHARKRAVDEVLQMLSGKKRVVFVLAELEGMTAPEIAEILQIPDATVRTRLFHARKEFAQKVEAHPGFADLFGGAR